MNTIRFLAMSFLFLMTAACDTDAGRTADRGPVASADALPSPAAQGETVDAECGRGQEGVCACDSDRCACGCEKKEGKCACGCGGDRDKCGCRGEDGQCNCKGDCPHRGEDGRCGCQGDCGDCPHRGEAGSGEGACPHAKKGGCGGHGDGFQSL
jgi:hypothetical protein